MLFSDPEGRISDAPPSVSMLDHGFLFGDSIYEVVRVYKRKIFGWKEHKERLLQSCSRIWIPIEGKLDLIEKRMTDLLTSLGEPDAALRMIITRGVGPLHINTRRCEEPRIYMAAWKYDASSFSTPVSLAIPSIRRVSKNSLDPSIKSGNYLNSVMGLRLAQDLGYDDALFLNPEGFVTELTTSNIGWISDGIPYTPSDDCGLLYGVTRKILMETHSVRTGRYTIEDLRRADEIFALSTFKEILPVRELRFENGEIKRYTRYDGTERLRASVGAVIQERLSREREWF